MTQVYTCMCLSQCLRTWVNIFCVRVRVWQWQLLSRGMFIPYSLTHAECDWLTKSGLTSPQSNLELIFGRRRVPSRRWKQPVGTKKPRPKLTSQLLVMNNSPCQKHSGSVAKKKKKKSALSTLSAWLFDSVSLPLSPSFGLKVCLSDCLNEPLSANVSLLLSPTERHVS